MLYYGQNMHQVMEYHEHSYLVSLLFAAPFLLFIIFSKFFSTLLVYNTSRKNIGNEKMGVGMALQKVTKQGRNVYDVLAI